MNNHTPLPSLVHDLAGQTFGRWAVLSFAGTANQRCQWLCRCACGTERVVNANYLQRGTSTSCGCLHRQNLIDRNRTHGMSDVPTYRNWAAMLTRCTNPKQRHYSRYGGRGIKVCDRWHDFQLFYTDMGPRPSPHHSIERMNNDDNYEPGNCRWANWDEQANNRCIRRDTLWVEAFGERKSPSDWTRDPRCVVSRRTLLKRIVSGIPAEQALTTPSHSAPHISDQRPQ